MFKGCGPAQLGRKRREADRGELEPEFLNFRSNDRQDKKRDRDTDVVSVSRHVHEIKTKVRYYIALSTENVVFVNITSRVIM